MSYDWKQLGAKIAKVGLTFLATGGVAAIGGAAPVTILLAGLTGEAIAGGLGEIAEGIVSSIQSKDKGVYDRFQLAIKNCVTDQLKKTDCPCNKIKDVQSEIMDSLFSFPVNAIVDVTADPPKVTSFIKKAFSNHGFETMMSEEKSLLFVDALFSQLVDLIDNDHEFTTTIYLKNIAANIQSLQIIANKTLRISEGNDQKLNRLIELLNGTINCDNSQKNESQNNDNNQFDLVETGLPQNTSFSAGKALTKEQNPAVISVETRKIILGEALRHLGMCGGITQEEYQEWGFSEEAFLLDTEFSANEGAESHIKAFYEKNHAEMTRNGKKSLYVDMESLTQEYFSIVSWYPEYKEQLKQLWWYSRSGDVFNTISSNSAPSFISFSENTDFIRFYSEAFNVLYKHGLHTPLNFIKSKTAGDSSYFPAPKKSALKCSSLLAIYNLDDYERDDAGDNSEKFFKSKYMSKRKYLSIQSDDANYPHPYFLNDLMSFEFDSERIPAPTAIKNIGYSVPETVLGIHPFHSNHTSYGWWVDLGESSALSEKVLFLWNKGIVSFIFHPHLLQANVQPIKCFSIKIPFYVAPNTAFDLEAFRNDFLSAMSVSSADEIDMAARKCSRLLALLPPNTDGSIEINLNYIEVPDSTNNRYVILPVLSVSQTQNIKNFTNNNCISLAFSQTKIKLLYEFLRAYNKKDTCEINSLFESIKGLHAKYPSDRIMTGVAVAASGILLTYHLDSENKVLEWLLTMWRNEECRTDYIACGIMQAYLSERLNVETQWEQIELSLKKVRIICQEMQYSYKVSEQFSRILMSIIYSMSDDDPHRNSLLQEMCSMSKLDFDNDSNKIKLFYAMSRLIAEKDNKLFHTILKELDCFENVHDESDQFKVIYANVIVSVAKKQEPLSAFSTLAYMDKANGFGSRNYAIQYSLIGFDAYLTLFENDLSNYITKEILEKMHIYAGIIYSHTGDLGLYKTWIDRLRFAVNNKKLTFIDAKKIVEYLWVAGEKFEQLAEYLAFLRIYTSVRNNDSSLREIVNIDEISDIVAFYGDYDYFDEDEKTTLVLNLFISAAYQIYPDNKISLWGMIENILENDKNEISKLLGNAFYLLATENSGEQVEELANLAETYELDVFMYGLISLIEAAILQNAEGYAKIEERIMVWLFSRIDEKYLDMFCLARDNVLQRHNVLAEVYNKKVDELFSTHAKEDKIKLRTALSLYLRALMESIQSMHQQKISL